LDNVFYNKVYTQTFRKKVEIKILYYDHNEDNNKIISYDQAVIEGISVKAEILDFMLSKCVMGIKRVPGVQHYDHVLMVMHLYVIEEDHSDVVWEQTPAPKPRLYPKLRQDPTPDPLQDPPQDWQYLQCLASVQPKVIAPQTQCRSHKPSTVHKVTKAFA
jgi:hypothetical protein